MNIYEFDEEREIRLIMEDEWERGKEESIEAGDLKCKNKERIKIPDVRYDLCRIGNFIL